MHLKIEACRQSVEKAALALSKGRRVSCTTLLDPHAETEVLNMLASLLLCNGTASFDDVQLSFSPKRF